MEGISPVFCDINSDWCLRLSSHGSLISNATYDKRYTSSSTNKVG